MSFTPKPKYKGPFSAKTPKFTGTKGFGGTEISNEPDTRPEDAKYLAPRRTAAGIKDAMARNEIIKKRGKN